MSDYDISLTGGVLALLGKTMAGAPRKTVFLDRDGVLNRRVVGGYVTRWSEFTLLPGVKHALRNLTDAGFQLVIVSNQAGVAKGQLSCDTLIMITRTALKEFQESGGIVDAAFFCLHQPSDNCLCRKPNPGLFERAMQQLPVDKAHSFMVGDSPADVQAGNAAGLRTILLTEQSVREVPASACATDLLQATEWILAQCSPTPSKP